jgi:hypothetical protein
MSTTEFMQKLRAISYPNPFDDHELVVGNLAVVEIRKDINLPNAMHLSSIRTVEPGKGFASRVLDKILAIADKTHTSITLSPKRFGTKGMSNSELRNWYIRHGFKRGRYAGELVYNARV